MARTDEAPPPPTRETTTAEKISLEKKKKKKHWLNKLNKLELQLASLAEVGTGSLEAVASEAKCVALREGFRWLASTSGVNFSWEASSVSSQQLTLARKAEKKYIREEPRQLYAFISPQCNAASRHTMLLQSELRPFRSCDGARYAALLLLGRRRRKKSIAELI